MTTKGQAMEDRDIFAEVRAAERTRVREMRVEPLGKETYEAGMYIIRLRLNESASTSLTMNVLEIAVLRDKISEFLVSNNMEEGK